MRVRHFSRIIAAFLLEDDSANADAGDAKEKPVANGVVRRRALVTATQ